MASLNAESEMTDQTTACCSPGGQESCCEPADKAGCCGSVASGEDCGCSAGEVDTGERDIREIVRRRYANAATAAAQGDYLTARAAEYEACCNTETVSFTPSEAAAAADAAGLYGAALYDEASGAGVPQAAIEASLGCGVPTAVADLKDGDVVLDLGSGAGADVLISARRVAPTGRAIGLDMTDEMLALARANAAAAGVDNVEFVKGYLEDMPLADASVDVVISNCVINLSGDKPKVIAEAARVLRQGGRLAVSDVIADPDMDEQTRSDIAAWTGCIAGALTEAEFRSALSDAGLRDVEIRETHRVHEHAAAAIIRAGKPK
jgi:ubiquinone/menaquinone biosynthesis C-methylase UbiE